MGFGDYMLLFAAFLNLYWMGLEKKFGDKKAAALHGVLVVVAIGFWVIVRNRGWGCLG